MTVTCANCGAEHVFPAGRGWKLADARSPCCGAMLRGAMAGVRHVGDGRGQGMCDVCRHPQYTDRLVLIPGGLWYVWPGERVGRLGAMARVCDWHSLFPRGIPCIPPGGARAGELAALPTVGTGACAFCGEPSAGPVCPDCDDSMHAIVHARIIEPATRSAS